MAGSGLRMPKPASTTPMTRVAHCAVPVRARRAAVELMRSKPATKAIPRPRYTRHTVVR